MLSGRETEVQLEGEEETQDTKVHPEVPHEEILFKRIIQDRQATPETKKEAEIDEGEILEEEAAIPESKLNIHNEEREGNTEVPAEESHGLHRWFGFFSPRKPGRESGDQDEERKLSGLGGEGEIIISGDSWQRGAGDGVMDGFNVHSPTERGLLRDDHPTEMDEKTFFNVTPRYKGEEKMAVATSQVKSDFKSIDEIFLFESPY